METKQGEMKELTQKMKEWTEKIKEWKTMTYFLSKNYIA